MSTEELGLVREVAIVLAIVLGVTTALWYARVNVVSGLLISGTLLSFSGFLGINILDHSRAHLLTTAHAAVISLFLAHGLGTSIDRLRQAWKLLVVGSTLQIGLTVLFGALAAPLVIPNCSMNTAVFVGILMATSSPALVYYELKARNAELEVEGFLATLVLIAHDMSLLVFAIAIPALAPNHQETFGVVGRTGLGVGVLFAVLALEWFAVRPLLDWAARKVPAELFLLAVAMVVLAVVIACMSANLAAAFGVFLAGVLIARTKYRNLIRGYTTFPRDVALPFFFVSVGSLLNWEIFFEHWSRILLSAVGLVLLKFVAATISALCVGLTLRPAMRFGGYLAHIGESAFVLGLAGLGLGVITKTDARVMIVLSVISIGIAPLLNAAVDRYIDCVPDIALRHLRYSSSLWHPALEEYRDHVIVIGYGRVGKEIARFLREVAKLPYLVIETNAERCDQAEHDGHKSFRADAKHPHTLKVVGADRSFAIVLTDCSIDTLRGMTAHLRPNADGRSPLMIIRAPDNIADSMRLEFPELRDSVISADTTVVPALVGILEAALQSRKEAPKAEPPSVTVAAS